MVRQARPDLPPDANDMIAPEDIADIIYFILSHRSNAIIDEINVQLIMERMGGGGHLNVAGAQLTGCTISEAKHAIMRTIDEMLEEGDIQE